MVVVPNTFRLPLILTLFELVDPDAFNDDKNVDALETNKLEKLVLLFKLVIFNSVDVEKVDKVFTST